MRDLHPKALQCIELLAQSFLMEKSTHEILVGMLDVISERLNYQHGVISLLDEDGQNLWVEAAQGLSQKKVEEVRYKKGEGITGLILQSKKPLLISRIGQDPRFLNRLNLHNPEEAFIGVPILTSHGEARGVLTCILPRTEVSQLDEHGRILQILANLIASMMLRLHREESETKKVKKEKDDLQRQLHKKYQPDNMVGQSSAMEEVFSLIRQVAIWDSTVLIRGESGTGKELVAKAIHFQSPRAGGPFIRLNCAALPDNLLESELFGYEKGAFTGAMKTKPGRFEMAHQGTIFLDEIGDTSQSFQAKLLRILQEGEFERLGGSETLKVNVRVLTATHVNLEQAVAKGNFREDLYYRLNVMPIFLPPLRERREDIPLLAEHFLGELATESKGQFTMEPEALEILCQCDFPGNVRELENCVRRAAMTSQKGKIGLGQLPCTKGLCLSRTIHQGGNTTSGPTLSLAGADEDLNQIANERDRVIAALKRAGWVQAKAARLLGYTPRQIAYRVKVLNITMEEF